MKKLEERKLYEHLLTVISNYKCYEWKSNFLWILKHKIKIIIRFF